MQVKDIESNSIEISLCSNWVCSKLQTVLHACSVSLAPQATCVPSPVMWCQVTTPVLTINNKIRPILDPRGAEILD